MFLAMTQFSPGFWRMRNGEKAEVFAERDGNLFGRIKNEAADWQGTGHFYDDYEPNGLDLLSPWVEAEKPFECWMNRYPRNSATLHPQKGNADLEAHGARIGPAIRMRQVMEDEQ